MLMLYYKSLINCFCMQPISRGASEESRIDRRGGLDDGGAKENHHRDQLPEKQRSEDLSDEELERRRNALLQQLHEEAD